MAALNGPVGFAQASVQASNSTVSELTDAAEELLLTSGNDCLQRPGDASVWGGRESHSYHEAIVTADLVN
jgi:hypothetical protein